MIRRFGILMVLPAIIASGRTEVPQDDHTGMADGVYPDTLVMEWNWGWEVRIQHSDNLLELRGLDENGVLCVIEFYRDDKQDSVATYLYGEAGKTETSYKEGQLHGWLRGWTAKGNLHTEDFYQEDTLVRGKRICFLDEGVHVDYIEIIEDGKVVLVDSSHRGEPEFDLGNYYYEF